MEVSGEEQLRFVYSTADRLKRWRKRRGPLGCDTTTLHGVVTQNTSGRNVTAVKTWR